MAALTALAFGSAGCGARPHPPTELMDGSAAIAPPVDLEHTAAILTKAQVVATSRIAPGSRPASCLSGAARDAIPTAIAVVRIGVATETVTFKARGAVVGCDNSRGPRENNRRWCGGAYGRLYRGRLRDPRLDIAGCKTLGGDPVAFAWVEPGPAARYVTVEQRGYAEVYEVVRRLPVRISTFDGIESDPLGATFDVSEHDAAGTLIRSYRLDARPAG
jgi:hypothetical protein